MNNKIFYYARVSSREQNLDRQIEAFKKLGADEREIICDKESGKDFNRSGYQALKNTMLRSGDTLIVKSLDRLSRNKSDIKTELQYFKDNNIRLKVIDLPTTMMDLPEGQEWVFDMVNNILIEVLGTIAEQERQAIRKRQREGIDAAKAKGKHLGRSCQIKKTVQIVPTVEPFVALGLLNLMPFDALLMLCKNLIKFDTQLPKNRHS